jgi:hypothetical protein
MTAVEDAAAEQETPLEHEPEPTGEPESNPDTRCEAETVAGGNVYRCALEGDHSGDHSFTINEETGEIEDPVDVQAQTEADMLDANKKVGRAAQTYWNKVREQYGDDMGGFHSCPLCDGFPPGLFWPSELPPEKAAALKQLLGLPSLENYRRDNAYLPCATCDGLGTVLTGSRVPANMTRQCKDCAGKGWITDLVELRDPARSPLLDQAAPEAGTVQDDPPPFDPWGRAYGDPDYYRMPIPGATT